MPAAYSNINMLSVRAQRVQRCTSHMHIVHIVFQQVAIEQGSSVLIQSYNIHIYIQKPGA